MTEPMLFYMRDNHTFRRLPLDVELAIEAMREERDDGQTYGMLCSKQAGELGQVHAYDAARWPAFESQARPWLAAMLEKHKAWANPPGQIEYDSWLAALAAQPWRGE